MDGVFINIKSLEALHYEIQRLMMENKKLKEVKTYIIKKNGLLLAFRIDNDKTEPYTPLLIDSVCEISNTGGKWHPNIYFSIENFKDDLLYEWHGDSELVIHPSSPEQAAKDPNSIYRYRLILPK